MRLIETLLNLHRPWMHVITVVGKTHLVDSSGARIPGSDQEGYYSLYKKQDTSLRKVVKIGNPGNSAYANKCLMYVKLWQAGGPLPPRVYWVIEENMQKDPPRGELVLFPGGKKD